MLAKEPKNITYYIDAIFILYNTDVEPLELVIKNTLFSVVPHLRSSIVNHGICKRQIEFFALPDRTRLLIVCRVISK